MDFTLLVTFELGDIIGTFLNVGALELEQCFELSTSLPLPDFCQLVFA